jgi:hypothetical protein
MVAGALSGLQRIDIIGARVLIGFRRTNPDVDELWPILKRAAHVPKYALEAFAFKN